MVTQAEIDAEIDSVFRDCWECGEDRGDPEEREDDNGTLLCDDCLSIQNGDDIVDPCDWAREMREMW